MSRKKVLVYCQYLLGIGHVKRCSLIVQAMSAHGFQVHVALGGAPVEHISFADAQLYYLTPVRAADENFSALVHIDGRAFSEQDKNKRCAELLALAHSIDPDVLIVETYPFGRRAMRFELKPLLQWAAKQSPKPLVVGSIRDILQRRRADREQESLELAQQYFDKVWVHGDQNIVPLEASFPLANKLADKLSYTGYVTPNKPIASSERAGILVSAGGGASGRDLMLTALNLFKSGYAKDSNWTFTTGPHLDTATSELLQSIQDPRLTVFTFIENLCEHMSQCKVSISMAGYNTTMDVLQSGVAAVMVPFIGSDESEQLQRTQLLQEMSRVTCLTTGQLSVENLARATDHAMAQPIEGLDINLDGANTAAKLLCEWLR